MEAHSNWYERTVKEISLHKDSLSKKDAKKYKLDLLLRIARRVDDFSATCGECQTFKQEITVLTGALGNLIQIPNKENRKSYLKQIKSLVKHLQKEHKLVTEGQYMAMWSGIGPALGIAFGAALDNIGIGVAIGVVIGLAIGRYMDNKAKKEGRVI